MTRRTHSITNTSGFKANVGSHHRSGIPTRRMESRKDGHNRNNGTSRNTTNCHNTSSWSSCSSSHSHSGCSWRHSSCRHTLRTRGTTTVVSTEASRRTGTDRAVRCHDSTSLENDATSSHQTSNGGKSANTTTGDTCFRKVSVVSVLSVLLCYIVKVG